MFFNKRKQHVFRGLTVTMTALFTLLCFVLNISLQYASTINQQLGITSANIKYTPNREDYKYTSDYDEVIDLIEAHKIMGERMMEESTVLLKNKDNTLPLKENERNITLLGVRSYNPGYGASMGATVSDTNEVRPDIAFEEKGFNVNEEMVEFYKTQLEMRSSEMRYSTLAPETVAESAGELVKSAYATAPTSSFAKYSDAAIVVIGRGSGEGADYKSGEEGTDYRGGMNFLPGMGKDDIEPSDTQLNEDEFNESTTGNILSLSDDERDLIRYANENFDKVIVLVNSTVTMELQELQSDSGELSVDAILAIGNPGAYGFYGIADILTGEVSPSGKTVDTYAVNTANAPAMENFGDYKWNENTEDLSGFNTYVIQTEGIYTGYKYYETRYYDTVAGTGNASSKAGSSTDGNWEYDTEVVYPFGYGLSYTTFSQKIVDSKIDLDGISTFEVEVTNTGETAGNDVVQIYVSLPYRQRGLEKSAVQLVGYGKTNDREQIVEKPVYLQPGETTTVTIQVSCDDYMTYDDSYEHDDVTGAYVLDEGAYYFTLGTDAHQAVQNVLIAEGKMEGSINENTIVKETLESQIVFTERNGVLIENQLQDADINNYDMDITYLSRSDWEGTYPKALRNLTPSKALSDALLKSETVDYELKTGEDTSDIEFGKEGIPGKYKMIDIKEAVAEDNSYDNPIYEELLSEIPFKDMVNILSKGSADYYIEEIGNPVFSAVDSPAGINGTLGTSAADYYKLDESDEGYGYAANTMAAPATMACSYSRQLSYEVGRLIGNDIIYTNTKWWFGPGANLHRTQYNGRNAEYYSEDAYLTSMMGYDVTQGAIDKGAIPCVKHFCFNEQETNRRGLAVFMNEQTARENSLRGYQRICENRRISLMTGYNRIGTEYCAANEGLITGILRNEWNCNGIVTTDLTMNMSKNKARDGYPDGNACIIAGTDWQLQNDSNLFSGDAYNPENILEDRALTLAYRESYHRLLYTFGDSQMLDGIDISALKPSEVPLWQKGLVTGCAVSGGLLLAALIGTILCRNRRYNK